MSESDRQKALTTTDATKDQNREAQDSLKNTSNMNTNHHYNKDTSDNNPATDPDDPPDEEQQPQQQSKIPNQRDRTPSIVVQLLELSFQKGNNNLNESIELIPGYDEEEVSQNSELSNADVRSSASCIEEEERQTTIGASGIDRADSLTNSARGSQTSLQNSSPIAISPRAQPRASQGQVLASSPGATTTVAGPVNTSRRLSLNITRTVPRRQSLTVDGLGSFATPGAYTGGGATGSLRNKVALKPGHSLMGWLKLVDTAKDLSGTNGKMIEVTAEELAKHDKEDDCWVVLKGNVYNVTDYLQFHPGGVDELMRGAGRDATELFNEVHRWVNYESILAKCLVGPYKLDSPLASI